MNGIASDNNVGNNIKLPKGKQLLDFSENYTSNGSAIMPGDMIKKKVQIDNGSQTADLEVQKEKRNNKECYEKVR